MRLNLENALLTVIVCVLAGLIVFAVVTRVTEIQTEQKNWITYKNTYNCNPVSIVGARTVTYL